MVHCGPFANVAHGNSSIIADKLGLHLAGLDGFVVTEAGFASDVGFEKFMDIKCRFSKLLPDCAVLVVTVRAIKAHGRDLIGNRDATTKELLDKGMTNVIAHIKNIQNNFQVPVVVALNRFSDDTDDDLNYIREVVTYAGVADCQITNNWAQGGKGATDLASSVIEVCSKSAEKKAKLLYEDTENLSIEDKIKLIATKVYIASKVDIPTSVKDKIAALEANRYGNHPVCMAKTHSPIYIT